MQGGKHGEIWYYALLGRKHVNKSGVLDCKLRVRWRGSRVTGREEQCNGDQ